MISNEIKTKLFAQYLEQNCAVVNDTYIDGGYIGKMLGVCTVRGLLMEHPKGSDGDEKIDNCKLILKKLSSITDEDAIEVANILASPHIAMRLEKDKSKIEWCTYWIEHGLVAVFNNNSYKSLEAFQFLQNKGYDLPNYLLNNKTLQEAGLAIYE